MRELVFRAIRRTASGPRADERRCSGLAEESRSCWSCSASRAGRSLAATDEQRRRRPRARLARCPNSRRSWPRRNGRRCSSARRSICASTLHGRHADDMLGQFDGATPTPLSPWGIRLPPDSRVDDHPAYRRGPGRGSGRGQPVDRARLRAARRRARPRSVRRCRREIARACRRGARCADPGNRHQPRALSKLPPRADRAGARDRNAASQPAE